MFSILPRIASTGLGSVILVSLLISGVTASHGDFRIRFVPTGRTTVSLPFTITPNVDA